MGEEITANLLAELSDCMAEGKKVDENMKPEEIAEVIAAFLKGIPASERMLFVGRYYHAMGTEDLAEKLKLDEEKVKAALYRIRRALRARLKKEGVLI